MASGSKGLRKVLGSIKDSTTVGLATINSDYKELDIAVVKATNHIECPPKEKHVRTIFLATASSRPRADVIYCIHALARRISKTHTWTVALKSMMVIHRLVREGDPTFQVELLNYAHNRGHILNLSNFKDESSPNTWDYSVWLRTYALYLEERFECARVMKYDIEAERSVMHSRTRELDMDDLLVQLPALQQQLHCLMGCQPQGAAISNYVIQAALSLVLKESFKLYRAINDGIINLVDKFFEMKRHHAIKALEIYKRATQQAERLVEFYAICKSLDFARHFQFPALEQPPKSFLFTMEEYVRDASQSKENSEDRALELTPDQGGDYNSGTPPPIQPMPEEFLRPPRSTAQDLMELNEGIQGGNRDSFALAIIPPGLTENRPQPLEVTGWELALVSSSSHDDGAVATGKLEGGFDKHLLDSLYDDALQRRYGGAAQNPSNPGTSRATNQFNDIFAASNNFAPPSPVTRAVMQEQAFLVQQQQRLSMTMLSANNPFGTVFGVPISPPPNSPPQSAQPVLPMNQYQNNPFGNPGLL